MTLFDVLRPALLVLSWLAVVLGIVAVALWSVLRVRPNTQRPPNPVVGVTVLVAGVAGLTWALDPELAATIFTTIHTRG